MLFQVDICRYICNSKIEVQCLTFISSEGYLGLLDHIWRTHRHPDMGVVLGKLFHVT